MRSGTEDINFQVFKLQTGMSKVSKYKSNVDNVIPKPPTLVVQMDPLDLATSMMGIQTPDPEDSVGTLDVDDNTSHQGSRSSREDDESERNDNFSNHIQEVTPPGKFHIFFSLQRRSYSTVVNIIISINSLPVV